MEPVAERTTAREALGCAEDLVKGCTSTLLKWVRPEVVTKRAAKVPLVKRWP
jgi:hypothetical protein